MFCDTIKLVVQGLRYMASQYVINLRSLQKSRFGCSACTHHMHNCIALCAWSTFWLCHS
jgi:hypothetical protein